MPSRTLSWPCVEVTGTRWVPARSTKWHLLPISFLLLDLCQRFNFYTVPTQIAISPGSQLGDQQWSSSATFLERIASQFAVNSLPALPFCQKSLKYRETFQYQDWWENHELLLWYSDAIQMSFIFRCTFSSSYCTLYQFFITTLAYSHF